MEDESVPDNDADSQLLKELKGCMRRAHGDPNAMLVCEQAFEAGGGVATGDGGKVFRAPDGGEAFVTHGGKVF